VQAFADSYTDDVVIRWMKTGRTATGRQAAADWIAEAFGAFDRLSNDIVGVYPSGSTVVLEVIARGTQVRAMRGIPAGRVLNNPEAYVYHFRDGKICEARCY
jgi:ketosteroid isomerase-like protein